MKKIIALFLFTLEISVFAQSCPDGMHPHYIDLGLASGTEWSCCNIGASSPAEFGEYYAWTSVSNLNLPSKEDVVELINGCRRESKTINGVKGLKFTGRNGNSIFLPCAGFHDDSYSLGRGRRGFYWTKTFVYRREDVYYLSFEQGAVSLPYEYPYNTDFKFSVRTLRHKR